MKGLKDSFLALDRAESTLESSIHDLNGGFPLATINRAYYAMFYCVCALLYTENIFPKSHKGVLLKFEELFILTEKFPKESSNWIRTAFSLRQEADYDFEAEITKDDAKFLVDNADAFFQLTKKYLNNLQPV